MSLKTLLENFLGSLLGESHGYAIGCVVDGCPPNIPISEKEIQKDMNMRRLGSQNLQLKEKRLIGFNILSGVFDGKTTGTPISMIIYNEDKRSRDYETIKNKFRPGHADYTYFKKYEFEIIEEEAVNLLEAC